MEIKRLLPLGRGTVLSLLFIFLVASPISSWAAKTGSEVPVTLFGNKCVMSGPFESSVLERIHSISPERIPPALSSKQIQDTLIRLEQVQKNEIPAQFSVYLQRSKSRLQALSGFYHGLDLAKKAGKIQPLIESTHGFMPPSAYAEFDLAAEKLSKDYGNIILRDQLLDVYQRKIEPDPEAEFHRTTKKLKIRYNCNFEGTEE